MRLIKLLFAFVIMFCFFGLTAFTTKIIVDVMREFEMDCYWIYIGGCSFAILMGLVSIMIFALIVMEARREVRK